MDKDNSDFRGWKGWPFCQIKSRVKVRNSIAIAFENNYPVVKHYSLVIPTRFVSSFFDQGQGQGYEKSACLSLMDELKNMIMKNDRSVTGFSVGVSDG